VVRQVRLFYSLDKGVTWKLFPSQPDPGSNPGSHKVTLPNKTKLKCKVKVVLKDDKARTVGSDVSDGTFTIGP
jgi:hypothetical protein